MSARSGRTLFLAASLLVAAVWVIGALTLPDRVPLHFDGGGQVDSWASRGEALLVFGIIGGALILVLGAMAEFTHRLPMSWYSLPAKDWWTATPEREQRLRDQVAEDMWLVSALTLLLVAAALGATMVAAHEPAPSLGWPFFVAFALYLVAIGALMWRMRRRYRPDGRDADPRRLPT